MFVKAFDTLKIPEILWKIWFAWAFCKDLFSCYAIHIFTWIWTCITHDLTDYHFNASSFLQAITFMRSDPQIIAWPKVFQQQSFPSVPSQRVPGRFQSRNYFFEVPTLIFYVLIWTCQSLYTICFRIFAAPVVWSILENAVLRLPSWLQTSNYCSKPPPRVVVCEPQVISCKSAHANRSGCRHRLPLHLRSAAQADLGALLSEAACRISCSTWADAGLAGTAKCRIRLCTASNLQFQNISVGFGHRTIKNCHVWIRTGTFGKNK